MLTVNVPEGSSPSEIYVPRAVAPNAPALRAAELTRPEMLEFLSLTEYRGVIERRLLTERQSYARWIVRRLLHHLESTRRGDGRIYLLSKSGRMRAIGVPASKEVLYKDARLVHDLRGAAWAYGCPSEHLDSAVRLVRTKLANKWGLNR